MKRPAYPQFVTHYYRKSRVPFLNLSDVPLDDLDAVIDGLSASVSAGESARVFGKRYMELRRLTEAKMHELFVESGGKPTRRSPHYFVLGASQWFAALSKDTQAITLPISELPTDVTSITYADSFTAMAFGPCFGLPYEAKDYHERVFRLEDLDQLVRTYGLPEDVIEDDYSGYEHRPFEMYVEVQLWSDEPIRRFLP